MVDCSYVAIRDGTELVVSIPLYNFTMHTLKIAERL